MVSSFANPLQLELSQIIVVKISLWKVAVREGMKPLLFAWMWSI